MLIFVLIFALILVLFKVFDKSEENYKRCVKSEIYIETTEEIIRREKTVKIIKYIVCYSFLTFMALFMIFPFYWMINTSLKTPEEISQVVPTFFPKNITITNYRYVVDLPYQLELSGKNPNDLSKASFNIWRLMYNTLIVGVWSTLGTLVTTVMGAFAFSRIKFIGREIIFTIFLATMMIPGEMMMITNYITVTARLGGMNKYWSMIIPFLISVYYIYLLRQNFKQIPDELYYAAKVDGTSDFKYLLKIMIPIAMPTIITITILKLMGAWNSYVWPAMVVQKKDMYLITQGLREGFTMGAEGTQSNTGQQMAAATVVLAPLLIVFMALRKYIMRGVSRSGIKG